LLINRTDQQQVAVDHLSIPGFDHVRVHTVDERQLSTAPAAIQRAEDATNVDFVLYARNDQVGQRYSLGPAIRTLRTGYSAISGIDDHEWLVQTRQVLADLRSGHAPLPLPACAAPTAGKVCAPRGTFSLIFDTEQLGGVRFGLPRILALLDRYGVKATFFVTGFVQQIYPELLPALAARGHEVGLHGQWHEWLAGLSQAEQSRRIGEHLALFQQTLPQHTQVVGANFIYRMDANTATALAEQGLRYFVVFAHHYYRPFAYRRPSAMPLPLTTAAGMLWLVPVPVQTYSLPWWGTRLLIDSALCESAQRGTPHVTVLMHPFRDGSQRHLPQLDALLRYLTEQRQLAACRLCDWVPPMPSCDTTCHIYVDIDRINASYPEGIPRQPWQRSEGYFARLALLYQALCELGHQPVVTSDRDALPTSYAIYPDGVAAARQLSFDPLLAGNGDRRGWQTLLAKLAAVAGPLTFMPPRGRGQWRTSLATNRPRYAQDLWGLGPEFAIRLAYRWRRGRACF